VEPGRGWRGIFSWLGCISIFSVGILFSSFTFSFGQVWCDDGFPRLVQRPLEIALTGKMSKRCACFKEDQLSETGLEVYEGCDYLSKTCRVWTSNTMRVIKLSWYVHCLQVLVSIDSSKATERDIVFHFFGAASDGFEYLPMCRVNVIILVHLHNRGKGGIITSLPFSRMIQFGNGTSHIGLTSVHSWILPLRKGN
jgi:hypothetical protein